MSNYYDNYFTYNSSNQSANLNAKKPKPVYSEEMFKSIESALPPRGWAYSSPPVNTRSVNIRLVARIRNMSEYDVVSLELAKWAESNKFKLTAASHDEWNINRGYYFVVTSWNIAATPRTKALPKRPCPRKCDGKFDTMSGVCWSCLRSTRCASCHGLYLNTNIEPSIVHIEEFDDIYCLSCSRHCANHVNGCPNFVIPGFTRCPEHSERANCAHCDKRIEPMARNKDAQGRAFCGPHARFICAGCGEFKGLNARFRNTHVLNHVCEGCFLELRDKKGDETFDNAEVLPENMKLSPSKFRPIRVCSIEMETAEGGHLLATELAKAKLSPEARVWGHGIGDIGAFCHVERDGSLGEGGGELIFNKIRLNTITDARKLHDAMRIVRNLVKRGALVMDTRCGLHIHIDAHGFGIPHVRNLSTLWNYLEDPLYRLGSANYYRHRGLNYAAKIDKNLDEDVQRFAMNFLNRNGHAHALNVSNYWHAQQERCGCGAAVTGQHEKCDCNLGKCTFEFRVYNGTTSFRKVHAYAALSQSLVSYARMFEQLPESKYPACEYEAMNVHATSPIVQEWPARLKWIFANLYFSKLERDNLMYAIRNSQLGMLGDATLAEIEATEYKEPMDALIIPAPAKVKRGTKGNARNRLNWGRDAQAVFAAWEPPPFAGEEEPLEDEEDF